MNHTVDSPITYQKSRPSRHRVIFFSFRILLGLMLLYKGIQFLHDEVIIKEVVSENDWLSRFSMLPFIIPWIHLIGGFFILIGLYTRISILVQIPLAVGAVIALYNSDGSVYGSEMIFAISILVLLTIYLIFGDGFYSWKKLIRKEKELI